MRGAVAAGHPLTARAGARVLEEGGNAVDACVAAAFAAWVTESPLTGPGAGGFALVVPAAGEARLADFFVATPGLGRPTPEGAEMHAIDVGFGGDSETTQVFRIDDDGRWWRLHRHADPLIRFRPGDETFAFAR